MMVILTNGYNGKWQIDKKEKIAGFSLYYETLPVIVIKKEVSKERQSFTLLHELAHLLLHHKSRINEDNYRDIEKEANKFAGEVLIPNNFLTQINVKSLKSGQYDGLDKINKQCGASKQTIMFRLLQSHVR